MSSNGNIQVRYDYDVFGKITAVKNGSNQAITDTSSLAFLNPLRYRGYYIDAETGLYYLMSCYYDPVTHRFINADGYFQSGENILDTNMFGCFNSAVCKRAQSVDIDNKDANKSFWDHTFGRFLNERFG